MVAGGLLDARVHGKERKVLIWTVIPNLSVV